MDNQVPAMDPYLYRRIQCKITSPFKRKTIKNIQVSKMDLGRNSFQAVARRALIRLRGGREFDPPLRNKRSPAALRDFCYVHCIRFILFIV